MNSFEDSLVDAVSIWSIIDMSNWDLLAMGDYSIWNMNFTIGGQHFFSVELWNAANFKILS